jgi:hypothetical protein
MGAIGIRQTINGLRVSSCTSGGGCLVLFVRDSGITDTVVEDIRATGGAVGFSDGQYGYTSDSMALFISTNNANTISMPHTKLIGGLQAGGHTWTLEVPMLLSGRIKNSGIFVGKDFSLLGCSTTLLLPAGNGFALSTPAGNTAVTSITPLDNGRRVTFIGSSGSVTFTNGTGLKTAGPVVAPGEAVTFECWGTTWHQITAKL